MKTVDMRRKKIIELRLGRLNESRRSEEICRFAACTILRSKTSDSNLPLVVGGNQG